MAHTKKAPTPVNERPGPMPLAGIVAELVDAFHDARDWPAGHRCTKSGPERCSHEANAQRALLVRVAHLIKPGVGPSRDVDPGKRARGSKGSPAPWATGPAHLVDEAHRGAIRFDRLLREALDLGPLWVHRGWQLRPEWIGPPCAGPLGCDHGSCRSGRRAVSTRSGEKGTPVDLAGAAALRGLPLLVELLQEKHPDHPLGNGPLVDPSRPDRGRTWGEVERAVRHWHHEARDITGHVSKPMIIRQRFNPFAGRADAGPTCEDGWTCGHLSCRLLFLARRPAWEKATCPHCGTSGFPQHPRTGEIYCDRPGCTDPDTGRRPSWSVEAFTHDITELLALEESR
jgi:hypothetical protein